jgi:hypothetical protein
VANVWEEVGMSENSPDNIFGVKITSPLRKPMDLFRVEELFAELPKEEFPGLNDRKFPVMMILINLIEAHHLAAEVKLKYLYPTPK